MMHGAFPILETVRDLGVDAVLVAFSGGKDSLVALDLAARVFSRVQPYFRYEVQGLAEHGRVFAAIEARYKCEVIRVPSPELASKIRYGAFLPRETNFKRDLKHVDIENYVRRKTGLDWIVSGIRMEESLQRRGMVNDAKRWRDNGTGLPETLGIDRLGHRLWPICKWGPQHVKQYLAARRLPLPVQTGMNRNRATDLSLNAENLKHLKATNPNDYRKMVERFPLAEVLVKRREMFDEDLAEQSAQAVGVEPGTVQPENHRPSEP
jgi:phosphoadenosine phosphosulfate reductase